MLHYCCGCCCCMQIWNHPDILYQFVAQRKEDYDLDLDDTRPIDVRDGYCNSPTAVMPAARQRSRLSRSYTRRSLNEMIDAVDMNKKDSVITYDWVGDSFYGWVLLCMSRSLCAYMVCCMARWVSVLSSVWLYGLLSTWVVRLVW